MLHEMGHDTGIDLPALRRLRAPRAGGAGPPARLPRAHRGARGLASAGPRGRLGACPRSPIGRIAAAGAGCRTALTWRPPAAPAGSARSRAEPRHGLLARAGSPRRGHRRGRAHRGRLGEAAALDRRRDRLGRRGLRGHARGARRPADAGPPRGAGHRGRVGAAGRLAADAVQRCGRARPRIASAITATASASSRPCWRTSDCQVGKESACPIAAWTRRRARPRSGRPATIAAAASPGSRGTPPRLGHRRDQRRVAAGLLEHPLGAAEERVHLGQRAASAGPRGRRSTTTAPGSGIGLAAQ